MRRRSGRITALECYGPTSFDHTVRLHEPEQLDSTVGKWLCRSWRRGNRESLDPGAHVTPLHGRPLGLVVVPLRARVVEHDDDLALEIPRYAGEVFADHPQTTARIAATTVPGTVEAADDRWRFCPLGPDLRALGLGVGDPVDAVVRADV